MDRDRVLRSQSTQEALTEVSDGHLFSWGIPMIDITAVVTSSFLAKYNLLGESTILASEAHDGLVDELTEEFTINYVPGGASQNTMRYITWVIGADICTFAGRIGDDFFGKQLQSSARVDGLKTLFTPMKKYPTGTCVCMVTEDRKFRTLIANLGAGAKYTKDDLLSDYHWVEKAEYYFLSGHAIAVCHEACMLLTKETYRYGDRLDNHKQLALNLGAPYVCEKFGKELLELFPYVDVVFANETQAKAFAKMQDYRNFNIKEIAKSISREEKKTTGMRLVVITRGTEPILLARGMDPVVKEFPVPKIPDDEIVDTNAAGDAFAGGFMSQYMLKLPIDMCMDCGIYCATVSLKQVGSSTPKFKCAFI